MLNFQCLCLFGFLFYVQAFLDKEYTDLVVKSIPKFPFSIDKTFEIIIFPKEEGGLLTNSISDTLVIQISKTGGTGKDLVIIDFGFKDSADHEFKGEFMKLKYWNISEENTLFIGLTFSSLADNQVLDIYHLNSFSATERKMMLNDLKRAKNMYRSNITLQFPSKIEMSLNSKFPFALLSIVDAVCRADNISRVAPSFHKIENMKVMRNTTIKNEANLRFIATIEVHGKNLTCQLGSNQKSIRIQVYHPPTKVIFDPNVTNVVTNGTDIRCLAADGFPIPRISWKFIKGPKDASKFYSITPYNQRLFLSGNAPIGSTWKFKCLSTNNIYVYYRYLSFKIVYKTLNNSNNSNNSNSSNPNVTSKYKSQNWNASENSDDGTVYEIKRTVSNHNQRINNLNISVLKFKKDLLKLKRNENSQNFEISKIKKIIDLLKSQVKDQTMEIRKMKKILDEEKKPVSRKVIFKKKEPTRKPNPPTRKPAVKFQWTVSGLARIRRKRKTIKSHEVRSTNFPLSVIFSLVSKSYYGFLVTVSMYPKQRIWTPPDKATLTVFNGENLNFNKSLVQHFYIRPHPSPLYFNFNYDELFAARILASDQIMIQLALDSRNDSIAG